jgi:two-component system chemotaxis response regulator CheB
MMKSVASAYGSRTVGVLRTGMLTDGVLGMKAIKEHGGVTIAQDEASSVVYGMPKAASDAGAVDHIANISEIPKQIMNEVTKIVARSPRTGECAPRAS